MPTMFNVIDHAVDGFSHIGSFLEDVVNLSIRERAAAFGSIVKFHVRARLSSKVSATNQQRGVGATKAQR